MGLDTVELVIGFEEAFGITIPDEEAARMLTPRMVLDHVARRVPVVLADGCLTQHTFYALRRGIRTAGINDVPLRPGTRIRELSDRASWPALWSRVRAAAGNSSWPESVPWCGFWKTGPDTLRQLVRELAVHASTTASSPWTRERMELTLRNVVHDVTGVYDFSLDDEFVRDMKLN